jgi:hypothetical protein
MNDLPDSMWLTDKGIDLRAPYCPVSLVGNASDTPWLLIHVTVYFPYRTKRGKRGCKTSPGLIRDAPVMTSQVSQNLKNLTSWKTAGVQLDPGQDDLDLKKYKRSNSPILFRADD